ncbi:hypothetical protein Hamer_G000698 [Homarus americanus]|uniref:Uncharacterized protein n=1 Tax=Homarus americanus TaxID=6706 RepID=A0A8J5N215_HOMAM|nr:hypothetical protein Hamer_G000698 [Homarus americanus]
MWLGTRGAGSGRGNTEDVHVRLVVNHLTLIQENLNAYFPESESEHLNSEHLNANMWVLNPFADVGVKTILELRTDYAKKNTLQNIRTHQGFLGYTAGYCRIQEVGRAGDNHVRADAIIISG